ncbi:unnamed protein product [Caenorhabditis auriculariae]|uniref:Uncharacterized protein n=1 Tax=Caenorhabditis auriculariae TaxID=2777116 RepID=A0A8S1HW32_9PELO|nr:unnamed protein product [Caenorhabditis auriculariae]
MAWPPLSTTSDVQQQLFGPSTEEWDSAPVSLVGPKCHSEVMLDTNIPMSKSRQKPSFFFLTEAKKKLALFD